MTVKEALRKAAGLFLKAGVPDARLDARLLLAQVLGRPQLELLAAPDLPLNEAQAARYFELAARRAAREPLQYILGRADFMGHQFLVRPGVLIPRADTEILAQRAIALLKAGGSALDLCCGSGILGISLQKARPDARVYAGDVSGQAIDLTRDNARALGAEIDARQGDLFAPFIGLRFDLIVCNPPYIPSHELEGLQEEVRREPALALDGGADGLHFYRRVLSEAPGHLNPGGILLLELGDGQAEQVSALLSPGFTAPVVYRDLGGLPRALETRLLRGVD